jgi:acetylornithine deacetylase
MVVVGSTKLGGATFASDAGHFAAAGVPTALFGPGRIEEAHVKDEYVEEEQLVIAAQVLALAISRYADQKDAAV